MKRPFVPVTAAWPRALAVLWAVVCLAPCLGVDALAASPKLATGNGHGAWLKPDGTVWTWGSNDSGQLGRRGDDSPRPAQVPGLSGVRDIACGADSTFVLLDDGRVLVFGGRDAGQQAPGEESRDPAHAQVPGLEGAQAVSAAQRALAVLAPDGRVWDWGDVNQGDGPRPLAGLDGVAAVARGETHGAALKKDGSVWLWGYHGAGDLGNGCYNCADEPVRAPDLSQVTAIAVGYQLTVALKKDGSVWTLGYGKAGQLGDGTRRSVSRPVKVAGLANVRAVAAGYMHVLAVSDDGRVWAWGDNRYGELGNPRLDVSAKDMNPDNRARPVRSGGLTDVAAVAAGDKHSFALTKSGELTGFGDNSYGALGADPEELRQADAPMVIGQPVPAECRALFSCQTASGKFIRLCGEQDPRDIERWSGITYRFGPASGPPELMYPSGKEAGKPGLFFSHTEFGGDYRVVVRFTSGAYTYRVFSGSKSGAGVWVEDAKGKRITTVNCIERPEIYPYYLWKALPCDRVNPHGEGACRESPFKGK